MAMLRQCSFEVLVSILDAETAEGLQGKRPWGGNRVPPQGQGEGTETSAVFVPAHAPCIEMGSKARSGAVPLHRKMENET